MKTFTVKKTKDLMKTFSEMEEEKKKFDKNKSGITVKAILHCLDRDNYPNPFN